MQKHALISLQTELLLKKRIRLIGWNEKINNA